MRLNRIALAMLATALLTTVSATAQTPTPAWQAIDQRDLGIEGIPIALSPDGTWIAGLDAQHETFCIWDVETLEPACDGDVDAVVPASVTWSPDSTAVAFSQNTPQWFVDSDIFVFEVASATLHNLTDDGDTELALLGASEVPVNIDLYPSWSPDSQHLIFARTVSAESIENPNTELMRIPRSGGEPETVLTLAPPYPMAVLGTMVWQEDDTILFPIWKVDPNDRQNGIWRTSLDGGIDDVLPGTVDEDAPFPVIADVSPDGSHLSVISLGHLQSASGSPFWLIGADGTSLVPVDSPVTSETTPSNMATAPGFAPDGEHITFLMRESDALTLTIGSTTSDEATTVATLDASLLPDTYLRSVDWAENDTIFVPTEGGTLITVEQRP